MQAVGFHQPGEPDVLEMIDFLAPFLAEGEARVRVHGAAANPADTLLRSGKRIRSGAEKHVPRVPGMDAAGVLEENGDGVETDLRVGDRVMAVVASSGNHDSYSEHIVVSIESVALAPRGFNHLHAHLHRRLLAGAR